MEAIRTLIRGIRYYFKMVHSLPDIHSLPEVVLIYIFQSLNINNRLKACLVCKDWLNIINCRKLLIDIEIKFSKSADEGLRLFSHMKRCFVFFSFRGITIDDSMFEFFKTYCKQFVTLTFINCKLNNIRECKIKQNILHWENLKYLDVQNSVILPLFTVLPNVTDLKLRLNSGLSDYVMSELNKSLQKLEIFCLGCKVCSDEMCKEFYGHEETPLKVALSFASIRELIEKNRATLRCIDFLSARIPPEALITISKIGGLKLRKVLFPFTMPLSCVRTFCENQLSLTSLDMYFLSPDINDTMHVLCRRLHKLEELSIKFNNLINNCIIGIFHLQHLVKLDLSCNGNISELDFREAVSNLRAFNLKHLNLAYTKISDESLFELLNWNRNIRSLSVSGTSISNRTLNMICKNLILLEYLVIGSCEEISDSGLTGEFENYSGSLTPTSLRNLKYLTNLNLSWNSLITNDGCIKAIRFLNLKYLYLNNCACLEVNDDFKIQLRKQNPRLQILETSHAIR